MTRRFQPPIFLPPREPLFPRREVPMWVLLLLVLSTGFIAGVGFLMIAGRIAP